MISISAGAGLARQLLQQVEDLRLHGDVERGGRLVGDDQPRLAGQRHRDHRALAHAAGVLVRIGVQAARRVGDVHALEQRAAASRAPAPRHAAVLLDRLGHLQARPSAPGSASSSAPGRSSRCGCRGSPASRASASFSRSWPSNSISPAAICPGGVRDQPQHRQRGDALARARLADDAPASRRPRRRRHVVHRGDVAALGAKARGQATHGQQRLAHVSGVQLRTCGAIASEAHLLLQLLVDPDARVDRARALGAGAQLAAVVLHPRPPARCRRRRWAARCRAPSRGCRASSARTFDLAHSLVALERRSRPSASRYSGSVILRRVPDLALDEALADRRGRVGVARVHEVAGRVGAWSSSPRR